MDGARIRYNPFDGVVIPSGYSFTATRLAEIMGIAPSTVCRDIQAGLLCARTGMGKRGRRCLGITRGEAVRYLKYKASVFGGRTSMTRKEIIYKMLDAKMSYAEIARRMQMKVSSVRKTNERRKVDLGGLDSGDVPWNE